MNRRCQLALLVLASATSVASAQSSDETAAPFELPKTYQATVDDAAKPLAEELQRGLAAINGNANEPVKLLDVIKPLRAIGFATQPSGAAAGSGAASHGNGGEAGEGRRGRGGAAGGAGGGMDPSARFQSLDANQDGKLTGSEIGPRMQGTERAADGVVTMEEFSAAFAEMMAGGGGGGSHRHGSGEGGGGSGRHSHGGGGHGGGGGGMRPPAIADAEFIINLDANKDRMLDADELLAAMKQDLIRNGEELIRRDVDADGQITRDEYAGSIEGNSVAPNRGSRSRFDRYDLNEDDVLSTDEIAAFAMSRSKPRIQAISWGLQLSASGALADGKVTPDELGKVTSASEESLATFGEGVPTTEAFPALLTFASQQPVKP